MAFSWDHAAPTQREVFRRAWNEATGRKGKPLIWAGIYKDLNIEPYVSVKEVIKILDNRVKPASAKTGDSPIKIDLSPTAGRGCYRNVLEGCPR
jgi:hypothetical protein